MTRRAVAAVVAVALMGASSDPTSLRDELHATATAYYADIAAVARVTSRDTVIDYLQRLTDDDDLLHSTDVPHEYPPDEWQAFVRATATLDISLAHQLITQHYRPLASIRGLGETLVRSSMDGTMQPVAVYVPASYVPGKAAPLVVFLHGHPQSETQLLAPPYVAGLAERTGSIVVAPYGRGDYDYRGSANDVYDALDAVRGAFTIDARKRYLVGYSMGGFSVFEVGPVRPNAWAAVMCISGALLGHDSRNLVATMSNTPFYVLTGSADDSIPTQYPTATAIFLQNSGVPVSYYSEAGGLHRLITLLPILTQAWDDMHHGVVRSPPPVLGNLALPTSPMMNAEKP